MKRVDEKRIKRLRSWVEAGDAKLKSESALKKRIEFARVKGSTRLVAETRPKSDDLIYVQKRCKMSAREFMEHLEDLDTEYNDGCVGLSEEDDYIIRSYEKLAS